MTTARQLRWLVRASFFLSSLFVIAVSLAFLRASANLLHSKEGNILGAAILVGQLAGVPVLDLLLLRIAPHGSSYRRVAGMSLVAWAGSLVWALSLHR